MRPRTRLARWVLATTTALAMASPLPNAAAAEPDDDQFASIRPAGDGWAYEIVISDGTGGVIRTPIDRPVIGEPALSPDGSRIVFSSWITNETDGRWGLFIANTDGTNIRKFTTPRGIDRDPAWSPDGNFIAFSRDTVGSTIASNCCHIRVKAVDRSSHVSVPGTTGGINPTWSPDGNQIAYQRPDGVQVTDVDGSNAYTLTGAGGFEPAWSPDGSQIAYLRPNLGAWEIAVRPADGGPDQLRVRSVRRLESPVWDPDGETIYYVRHLGEGYDGRSDTAVWMQAGASDPVRLYRSGRNLIHLSHHPAGGPAECDFDGDESTDLAIGIPGENEAGTTRSGAVGVLYGTGSGLDASGDQFWSQNLGSIKGTPGDGHAFGAALACGDFDADGDSDLAIGIPGDTGDAGAVTVILGTPTGLTAAGDQRWHQDVDGISGQAKPDNQFGTALATGDIDNDGYADLAIGIPGDKKTAGAVSIFFGGNDGLSGAGDERWHQDIDGIGGNARAGNAFGSALTIADFDSDGYDDLAIGIPGDKKTAGAVEVIYGTSSGLEVAGDQRWHQDSAGIGGNAAPDHSFGAALASGDFDRDGFDDLAIGIPGAKGTAGVVTVLYGTSSGLSAAAADRWHQDVTGIGGVANAGNEYGSALATSDFDGDGYTDLAIGIPGDKNTAGAVGVLYGSSAGLTVTGDQRWHQDSTGVAGSSTAGNVFGAALFGADFDGDGRDDLAIGSPGDKNTKGTVTVLYGTATGLGAAGDQRWHQDVTGIEDSSEKNDRYGGAL